MNKTEALEFIASQNFDGADDRAIAIMATMLVHKAKEALAESEQEPVAQPASEEDMKVYNAIATNYHKDLSTSPKREWVAVEPVKRSGFEYMEGFVAGFKSGSRI